MTRRVVFTLLVLGFVPALVLSWIYELTPQGLKRESEVLPEERVPRLTARKFDRILISALAAIVALLLIDLYVLAPQRPATSVTAGSESAEPAAGTLKAPADRPSLAVLPFLAFGAGAEDDYFADGMTDDIITDLSKLSGIFVISRNSSSTYKGKSVKVQQVAKDLGVRYLLEGSVRRAGDTVRVNAQLVDAIGGQHLWAERYDGSLADVFALQDKVIGQIVAALAVNLTRDEAAGVQRVETGNAQAYDALLQGWAHYRRGSEEENNRAIEMFEHAINLDPQYSRAHAALAAAYWRIAVSYWQSATQRGTQRAYDRMRAHLGEAMRQPNALAYSVSAEVLSRQGRYDEAFAEIDRAMALAPGNPDNYLSRARTLNATGRAAEAEAAVRQAMRLDPLYPPDYLRALAISQFHQERYEDAVATLKSLFKVQSDYSDDYVTLIACLGQLGRKEGVAEAIATVNHLNVDVGYFNALTVQMNGAWWWYGDMFDYDPQYRERLVAGLRKAGVPEGAGTDVPYERYRQLISRKDGEYEIAGTTRIDLNEAKALHERGIKFIDVRAVKDFGRGHIPGAYDLDVATALSRVVGKDEEFALSCHGTDCSDSVYACAKAASWGFKRVHYFAGGFPAWQEAGYPVDVSSAL